MSARVPLLSLLLFAPMAWGGVTIEVPADRPTLASALNFVSPGDTIRLGVGTHVLPAGRELTVPVIGSGPGTVLVVNGMSETMVVVGPGETLELAGLTLDAQGARALECVGGTMAVTDVVLENGGVTATGSGGGLARFVDCEVFFDRVVLRETSVAVDGGLLSAVDSNLTLVGSSFVDGEGTNGGALHLTGGTLNLLDTVISGSEATTGDGGGLHADGTAVRSVNTTWLANRAASGAGGGAWIVDGSYESVGETFTGNQADQGAGGLRVLRSETTVSAAQFGGNASAAAGGLQYRGPGDVLVQDSRFSGNAGGNGGGLALDQPSAGRFERNRFCDNLAQGTGLQGNGAGANVLRAFGGSIVGANNLFVGNAADDGGGLYPTGGAFAHDTYVRNSAVRGSAAVGVFGVLEVRDSVFLDNAGGEVIDAILALPPLVTTSVFFDNDVAPAFTLDPSNLVDTDPQLVDPASAACDAASFTPMAGSPLIDAASDLDADGSPADIGAFGGPSLIDADGDGIVQSADCDDLDSAVGRPTLWFTDADGDGFGRQGAEIGCGGVALAPVAGDCDDGDATRFPGADDIVNGEDDDCDLLIDEDGLPWYRDQDGDGFGDPEDMLSQLTQPVGYVDNADDCADDDGAINPLAAEICGTDDVDEDCDSLVDDQDPDVQGQLAWPIDNDGDGFGSPSAVRLACVQPAGTVLNTDDCDDTDSSVNPAAVEVCDVDGEVDEDCDTLVDDLDPDVTGQLAFFVDDDGDGFAGTPAMACVPPADASMVAADCDDTLATVNPDADEVCGGGDEDCDQLVDDADDSVTGRSTWFRDGDLDGFGAVEILACVQPVGAVTVAGDCDDTRDDWFPGAPEVCGGGDANCNGLQDDADPTVTGDTTFFTDADGDTFAATPVLACVQPVGASLVADDCNDADPTISPAATEVCDPDDVDEDCNFLADDLDPAVEGQTVRYTDADGDGFGDAATSQLTCEDVGVVDASDCDDADASVGAPVLRYPDADGDGFGDASSPGSVSCDGVLDATDCDDTDAAIRPDAVEIWYDGVDQDCDGADDDQDGDGVLDADDCDDTDAARYPGAVEVPDDGVDQDCDLVDAVFVYSNGSGCGCAAPGSSTYGWAQLLRRRR